MSALGCLASSGGGDEARVRCAPSAAAPQGSSEPIAEVLRSRCARTQRAASRHRRKFPPHGRGKLGHSGSVQKILNHALTQFADDVIFRCTGSSVGSRVRRGCLSGKALVLNTWLARCDAASTQRSRLDYPRVSERQLSLLVSTMSQWSVGVDFRLSRVRCQQQITLQYQLSAAFLSTRPKEVCLLTLPNWIALFSKCTGPFQLIFAGIKNVHST